MQSMAGSCELFVAALVPLVMSQIVRLEQSDAATWISWELSGAAEINPNPDLCSTSKSASHICRLHANVRSYEPGYCGEQLKPIIDKVFSLDDAPKAYRYLQLAQHFGKVVISVG
jgi:Zinc-binding dehydrogenase